MFNVKIVINADGIESTETFMFANTDADGVLKSLRDAAHGMFYMTDIYGKCLFLNLVQIKCLQITVTNVPSKH